MNKLITFLCVISNMSLLIFSYVAIDDVHFRMARWDWNWDANIFILSIFVAPLSCLLLIYLSVKENWLEYLKLSLQRRRLEGQRAVMEEKEKIRKLGGD